MKKVIAFSGSNSSKSINKQLVQHAAELLEGAHVEVLDLMSFDIPMFSTDIEEQSGIPADVKRLFDTIQSADAVMISTPEHNGLMPAFFKNILDWLSRVDMKWMPGKAVVAMSTSPGGRGGQSALDFVSKLIGYSGADLKGTFALPSFYDAFNGEIVDAAKKEELKQLVNQLLVPAQV